MKADFSYLAFPAWVDVCRQKNNTEVPKDLAPAYFKALARLPALVAAASAREWDASFLQSALAAIAISKGQAAIAEAAQELSPEVAEEFMQWFWER